jgi:hypothetical protein
MDRSYKISEDFQILDMGEDYVIAPLTLYLHRAPELYKVNFQILMNGEKYC